jgi:hypothetical protein
MQTFYRCIANWDWKGRGSLPVVIRPIPMSEIALKQGSDLAKSLQKDIGPSYLVATALRAGNETETLRAYL